MPTLRPATAADWPAIDALLRACQLPTDGARDHLASFLVAEWEGALVGVAGLEVHGSVGLLRSVAIAEHCRHRTFGDLLVGAVVDQARASGLESLCLLTTTAVAYFERRGFTVHPRDAAPPALQASAEFKGACPASAAFMRRHLSPP